MPLSACRQMVPHLEACSRHCSMEECSQCCLQLAIGMRCDNNMQPTCSCPPAWPPCLHSATTTPFHHAVARTPTDLSTRNHHTAHSQALISMTALSISVATQRRQAAAAAAAAATKWPPIKKIAFGSCTAYDLRPQRVWVDGVIPAAPDAWVWLGDMAYM